MSTKWTKNSAVQQPPPVCKKPPAELPAPEPPFNKRTMQCFVQVIALPLTPPFYITAIFDLPFEPPDTTWENGTNYAFDNVAVLLFSPPPYELFNVTIDAFRGVTLVATHTFSNVEPQSRSPFALPYLGFDDISPPRRYIVKITE